MMHITTRPPPPQVTTVGKQRRERKVYTVTKRPDDIFSVQLRDKQSESLKTTILAFSKESDAVHFACMLEEHRALTKEWPTREFEDMNGINMVTNALHMRAVPHELLISQWNMTDLQLYCTMYFANMLHLSAITKKGDGNFRLRGELIKLDTPLDFQAGVLELLYATSNDNYNQQDEI